MADEHNISPKTQPTIIFIPERLNRPPVVYRGMSFAELCVIAGLGAGLGLVTGILVMLAFSLDWAVIPTAIVLFGVIGVRSGGLVLSRLKRGKPEGWIERYLDFKLRSKTYVTEEGYWSIKRSRTKGRVL